jgi:hypothetical protein
MKKVKFTVEFELIVTEKMIVTEEIHEGKNYMTLIAQHQILNINDAPTSDEFKERVMKYSLYDFTLTPAVQGNMLESIIHRTFRENIRRIWELHAVEASEKGTAVETLFSDQAHGEPT